MAAVPLAVSLVPRFGLTGAAWTLTLGTAVQQVALTWVLRRRLGFTLPGRALGAWIVLSTAALLAAWLDPGRITAALLTLLFLLLFALVGRVTVDEVKALARRLLGGSRSRYR
jgi:peptidoglycan biosynthesis protein MviN/MurJ (putative lipid II flippase)